MILISLNVVTFSVQTKGLQPKLKSIFAFGRESFKTDAMIPLSFLGALWQIVIFVLQDFVPFSLPLQLLRVCRIHAVSESWE